jgi:hypothetical protein
VKNAGGKPLKGCVRQVSGRGLATPIRGATNEAGRCHLDLPAGTYQFRIVHPEFSALTRSIKAGGGD